MKDKEHVLGIVGLALLIFGCSRALLYTPPETHMQDVQRIFFLHVPTAWNAMLVPTTAFFLAIGALVKRSRKWDAGVEAACEVTVLFTIMTLAQGMIWGRPTWGAYWDWDPRLTTTAIMAVLFAGVLSVRSFAASPEQRITWTAVATIIAYADVPIVYKSVEWWDSLHQKHSAPATVSPDYYLPLRVNAIAILLIWIWLVIRRSRVALLRDEATTRAAGAPKDTGLVAGDS